jgi:hypothetical protein
MPVLLAVLSLPALAVLAVQLRRGRDRSEWARVGLLFALGLFVTGPFQHERALGAGDAANYAHAVADTVVQLRAGVFPVFVGQSVYAFNGRVHPLRTAPYYNYAAGLLDLLTAHRLNYWGVQNGLLALSLMAGLFSAYVCLRRLGTAGPWTAAGLAAAYGLSPGLLACAYGQDLYMTVTTAPFLPIALLGAIRGFAARTLRNYSVMAIGLAALWLSHPPVAAWISLGCGGLVAVSWCTRRPTGRAAGALAAAAGLGLVLSVYGFVSALSLSQQVVGSAPASFKALSVDALGTIVRQQWRASLLPVGDAPTSLGSFQLGYVLWGLALASLAAAWRRGAIGRTLAGGLAFYLLLVLPLPGVSRALWMMLPFEFITLTNIWPMQRAYLVLAAWTVFAAAWILPSVPWARWRRFRTLGVALIGGAGLWACAQAGRFVMSGYLNQRDDRESARLHRPENANLTVTAYALLRPPTTFTSGTMDPEREFRLIRPGDGRPLRDNWGAGAQGAIAARGVFHVAGGDRNGLALAPALTLMPGRRYVLRFKFLTPPFDAELLLNGGTLQREYHLPSYIGAHGFGMGPGNNPALPLWTTAANPSVVRLRLASGDPRMPVQGDLAEFTLEETDRAKLPVELEQLEPELRCRVRAPEDAWLVTPRMYVRGYIASVDGRPARAIESDEGMVLVAVPAGVHEVELRYVGFPALRWAFFTTLAGWLGVLGAIMVRRIARGRLSGIPGGGPGRAGSADPVALRGRRGRLGLTLALALAALIAAAAFGWGRWHRPASAGPIQLKFWLPIAKMGDLQVLITSGRGPNPSTVFVRYVDAGHIQVGLDAPGRGYAVSEPVAVAYSRLQTLAVTAGSFYPDGDPRLAGRSPAELDWLRGTLRIWLNGREVLTRHLSDYRAGDSQVEITSERTGGPDVLRGFTGTVVSGERLPVAAAGCPLAAAAAVRSGAGPVRLRFALPPDRKDQTEPLLAMGRAGAGGIVFVRYVDGTHVQIGFEHLGRTPALTEPLAVDYAQAHELTVTTGALYPPADPAVAGLDQEERDWLHSHVRVAFDGRAVIARRAELDPAGPDGIEFGRESLGTSFTAPLFNGVLLGLERQPIADSGYLPATAAQAGGRAGPLRIRMMLPAHREGRSEPLVTTGVPGNAMFLFLNYVDATHLRIGLDLWGAGVLAYGDPVTVDPGQPQEFLVTAGALYPADDPAVAALGAEVRSRLGALIEVSLNHRVIFRRSVAMAAAKPETVTVGESRIGGSNTEAAFTGDILDYGRLPPAAAPQPAPPAQAAPPAAAAPARAGNDR